MTTADKSANGGMPLWIKLLLAGSLTLNLMVAGVVVGARIGDGPGRDNRGDRGARSEFDPALGPFARALPDDYRDRAAEALAQRSGDHKDNRAALASQLQTMISALRADPYDPTVVRDAMSSQDQMFRDRALAGREAVLDQIDAMSPDERQAFADRLEKGFRRAIERAKP